MIPLTDRFTEFLPGDTTLDNYPRQVPHSCYSFVTPKGMARPELLHWNHGLASKLNLEDIFHDPEAAAAWMAGNTLASGSRPYAMRYGGHQFGHWAGQLGDGRAINLGEVATNDGPVQLQLKGAGPTPYSRTADGLAVLRSSIREYLCSEAMYALGVPTTRALALVRTGESVTRDMFYNGDPKEEPGAVVCRTSPSFMRFGNFEILAADRNRALLTQLADFTIKHWYPHLQQRKDTYLAFFREVTELTCNMIVEWQRVGFVHGVMNTDNMSVLGLTIDYGPYGWLDNYDPQWTPNTTDLPGKRYCFGNQPAIAQWNLLKLANALYPLIQDEEAIKDVLIGFKEQYEVRYMAMMRRKLGLLSDASADAELVASLEKILTENQTDMTMFFRNLANVSPTSSSEQLTTLCCPCLYNESESAHLPVSLQQWIDRYQQRLSHESREHAIRKHEMDLVNPKYVLRNYMAQMAIEEAEKGSTSLLDDLFSLLQHPYDEQPEHEKWFARRPEWARQKAGCSMLSCSS